jgi:hypothetical protein
VTPADVDLATVDHVMDRLLAQPPELGVTLAILVVHRGEAVAEGYGPGQHRDLVLVRLGETAADLRPSLVGELHRLIRAFLAG